MFYDVEIFSAEAQRWLRLNPMVVLLESYRRVLLEASWPELDRLAIIALTSTVALVAAAWALRRFDHVYPKLRL